jgi:hypothetical protein
MIFFLLSFACIGLVKADECNSCEGIVSGPCVELGKYPKIIQSSCFKTLIKNGNLTKLEFLLDSPEKEADITEAFDLLTQYKKTLGRISNLLDVPENIQTSSASFRWAQSLTDIYIEVRFSHRIDTAGCVDIHDLTYEVLQKHLKVEGKCLLSGHKIRFVLDFDLLKEIIPKDYEVNKEVQGRVSFKLKKKKSPDVWNVVYSGQKPFGMSLWHDMQDDFQKSIDKFKRKNDL